MEAAAGTDLRISMRSQLLPTQLSPWMLGLARALEHLHGQGIIHRDVKPSNCMVTQGGDLVLVDYGLAVQLSTPHLRDGSDGGGGGGSVLKRYRVTDHQAALQVGVIPYMAPEVYRATIRAGDRRVCVWDSAAAASCQQS